MRSLFFCLRSSKVIAFGANRKRVYEFLLAINSNLGPISGVLCVCGGKCAGERGRVSGCGKCVLSVRWSVRLISSLWLR